MFGRFLTKRCLRLGPRGKSGFWNSELRARDPGAARLFGDWCRVGMASCPLTIGIWFAKGFLTWALDLPSRVTYTDDGNRDQKVIHTIFLGQGGVCFKVQTNSPPASAPCK